MSPADTREAPLDRAIRADGLDGVVATSPSAVFRLSGAWINSQRLIPERIAAVLLRPAADPVLLINDLEEGAVRPQTKIADIRTYGQFSPGPANALVGLVRSACPDAARIGVEARWLTKQFADALTSGLPGTAFVPVDSAVDALLAAKEPWEAERLTENARLLDAAITEAARITRAGDSERDLGTRIVAWLAAEGRGNYSQLGGSAASGPNAHVTHYGMGERRLQPGDFVRLTSRGVFKGYNGIVARSAVVGPASAHQRKVHDDLVAIHGDLLGRLTPGRTGAAIFHETAESYARHGHRLGLPHVGHSVGLSLQERPQFHPLSKDALAAGMMCVAITVLDEAKYGKLYLEDVVRITDDGAIRVSGGPLPPGPVEIGASS